MIFSNKLLNILLTATLTISCTEFTNKLNAAIPEYKNLYTIFTKETDTTPAVDTIGIGQSLLYSNWIENIYTYAPKDNAARKVIETLWFKHLNDLNGNFNESDNFRPSTHNPINKFSPKHIGELIKYIRDYKKNDPKNRPTPTKIGGVKNKQIYNKLFTSLEELKCDKNFIPEMAESILWAFFESKTNWGDKEFRECLSEIDPNILNKLSDIYTNNDFEKFDKNFSKSQEIENFVQKIINKSNKSQIELNVLNYYLIKSAKTKNIPNKVLQANLKCKHPDTGTEPKEPFPTCFESAILDLISILIYDRDKMLYDTTILPENIQNNDTFKNFIKKIFTTDSTTNTKNTNQKILQNQVNKEKDKNNNPEFIHSENINNNNGMQNWINLVSNLQELKYQNNDNNNRYDLNPSFENFVKVLNKFLGLGFEITDTKDTLEITLNIAILKNSKIIIKKDKLEYWQALFNLISCKLSTTNRPIEFKIEKQEVENVEFKKINTTGNTSYCIGTININIGETNLHMIIKNNHAYIICPERDKSGLEKESLKELKKTLLGNIDKNKNLIPLFMFLPYVQTIENRPQIEELLYYSFNLRDHNIKLDFLKNIFDSNQKTIKNIYNNQDIQNLVTKLIDLLPENDAYFINKLIKYYYENKDNCPNLANKLILKISKSIEKSENSNLLNNILSISALNGYTKIVENLLKNNYIEVNCTILRNCEIKKTPFHLAIKHKHIDIIKMLLNHPKINVNLTSYDNYPDNFSSIEKEMTPIFFAFKLKNIEIIEILIKHPKIKIEPEIIKDVVIEANTEILKILLRNPSLVDIFAKNYDGKTVKDLVKSYIKSYKDEYPYKLDQKEFYKEYIEKYREILELIEQKEKEMKDAKEEVKQFTSKVIDNIERHEQTNKI